MMAPPTAKELLLAMLLDLLEEYAPAGTIRGWIAVRAKTRVHDSLFPQVEEEES